MRLLRFLALLWNLPAVLSLLAHLAPAPRLPAQPHHRQRPRVGAHTRTASCDGRRCPPPRMDGESQVPNILQQLDAEMAAYSESRAAERSIGDSHGASLRRWASIASKLKSCSRRSPRVPLTMPE